MVCGCTWKKNLSVFMVWWNLNDSFSPIALAIFPVSDPVAFGHTLKDQSGPCWNCSPILMSLLVLNWKIFHHQTIHKTLSQVTCSITDELWSHANQPVTSSGYLKECVLGYGCMINSVITLSCFYMYVHVILNLFFNDAVNCTRQSGTINILIISTSILLSIHFFSSL